MIHRGCKRQALATWQPAGSNPGLLEIFKRSGCMNSNVSALDCLHLPLLRMSWQMLAPPHSRHSLFFRLCPEMPARHHQNITYLAPCDEGGTALLRQRIPVLLGPTTLKQPAARDATVPDTVAQGLYSKDSHSPRRVFSKEALLLSPRAVAPRHDRPSSSSLITRR